LQGRHVTNVNYGSGFRVARQSRAASKALAKSRGTPAASRDHP